MEVIKVGKRRTHKVAKAVYSYRQFHFRLKPAMPNGGSVREEWRVFYTSVSQSSGNPTWAEKGGSHSWEPMLTLLGIGKKSKSRDTKSIWPSPPLL